MEKSAFDDYFGVLDKAGDRTRSILYAFIIIYITVLVYAISAFAYPMRQFNFDAELRRVECLYAPDMKGCDDKEISEFVRNAKQDPRLKDSIQENFWEHRLGLIYDESVAQRTFKLPFFGLEIDEDLLWWVFPSIGIIGYFIIWLVLARSVAMFTFLLDRNQTDPARLRLIQSTAVITTPLNPEPGDITPSFQLLWRFVAVLVLFIPVIVSLLGISAQTNFIPAFVWPGSEARFLDRGINTWLLVKLGLQTLAMLLQLALFGKLFALGRRFGREQRRVDRLLVELERNARRSADDSLRRSMAAQNQVAIGVNPIITALMIVSGLASVLAIRAKANGHPFTGPTGHGAWPGGRRGRPLR
ncbi:MAG: hypothetical protein JO227_07055 [Acetobacteraceae bacterium]|nr:hypothetical protein [Acetobacteraceae bacterium]